MSSESAVVAVLGYGCHLTTEIGEYLEKVASFVAHNPTEAIITSGGFTNQKTAPERTEAGMMAFELEGGNEVDSPPPHY